MEQMIYVLHEKQVALVRLTESLIDWTFKQGWELTDGEAYRPSWVAQIYAKMRKGIPNSLHILRLARDFNLFVNGVCYSDPKIDPTIAWKYYLPLGEYWESLSTPGLTTCWGGRFSRPDSDHFSIEHQGVR